MFAIPPITRCGGASLEFYDRASAHRTVSKVGVARARFNATARPKLGHRLSHAATTMRRIVGPHISLRAGGFSRPPALVARSCNRSECFRRLSAIHAP